MKKPNTENVLAPILKRDDRFSEEAYIFVREALDYTVRKLEKPRHVSGRELLEGIREYTLSEFGPVAKRVLSEWGITECIDFGHIVFNLVNEGLLGKTDEDSIEDFMGGYDFSEAFTQPFRPKEPVACKLGDTVSAE
jgi:uncharacterized repeat protein (TIGR04138 family)